MLDSSVTEWQPRRAYAVCCASAGYGRAYNSNVRTTMNANAEYLRQIGYREVRQLLVGIMMAGISYVDRQPDNYGTYWRLAFLPFDTLVLEVSPGCPVGLLAKIAADAATIIARRGERFEVTASGRYVILGG